MAQRVVAIRGRCCAAELSDPGQRFTLKEVPDALHAMAAGTLSAKSVITARS
jgi:hypothetical protein